VPDRADLHRQAVQRWVMQRRQAVSAFVIPTVICWLIWVMVGLHQSEEEYFHVTFPWPLFVMFGTGAGLVRLILTKQEFIAQQERRLEKRQRRLDARDE